MFTQGNNNLLPSSTYPLGVACTPWACHTHPLLLNPRPSPTRTVRSNFKNPPKIWLRNSWNWLIILMPATVWHSEVNEIKWPETDIVWICWNLLEKNFIKSNLTYFWRVLAIWNHCCPQSTTIDTKQHNVFFNAN